MGAINNAFNQAVGAAAGAALAIKHAKETEETKTISAENAALVARNQARTAEAEANEATNEAQKEGGLVEQLANAEVKKDEANKAYNKAINRKNGSPVTILEKMTELRAAQKAANSLKVKIEALNAMTERAQEQIAHAARATQLAEEIQQRYQSKWGGIK